MILGLGVLSVFEYHICPHCGNSYKWKGNLQKHLKLECGKLPQHSCTFCEYKSHHKANLQRHIQNIHVHF